MSEFSYDIGPEDAIPVLLEQRTNLMNQLTTSNIELRKARQIISQLNLELQQSRESSTETHETEEAA